LIQLESTAEVGVGTQNVGTERQFLRQKLNAARDQARANAVLFEELVARVDAARANWVEVKDRRQMLQDSAYSRLLAKLESQPVIEQAKGILMAHYHCGPDDAFERLRRISQQHNVRVRDLAADIVKQVARPNPHREPAAHRS
jgi:ANTAR domain